MSNYAELLRQSLEKLTAPAEMVFAEFDRFRAIFQASEAIRHLTNLCGSPPSLDLKTMHSPAHYASFSVEYLLKNDEYGPEGYSKCIVWSIWSWFSEKERPGKFSIPMIHSKAATFLERKPFKREWGHEETIACGEIFRLPRFHYTSEERLQNFLPKFGLVTEAVMTDMLRFQSLEELMAEYSQAFAPLDSSDENTLKENHHD